jgi:hypothetical protein
MRICLWATAFLLLVAIFYLIHLITIAHAGPRQEDVDIFVKLPIFLTGVGFLWTMLLILFTQMTASLKDDF